MDEQTARRLMAHETHGHEGEQSPIEISEVCGKNLNGETFVRLSFVDVDGSIMFLETYAYVFPESNRVTLSVKRGSHSLSQLMRIQSLLQRAKEIMERGS